VSEWQRHAPRVTGWLLAVATVACVLGNQRDVGIARDETVYMSVAPRYAAWWFDLFSFHGVSRAGIAATFGGAPGSGNNSEHPPLVKTLMGASHALLYKKLGVVDELTAFRVPGALFHGVCVLLVYTMTLELWGFAEAVLAALCLVLLPRIVSRRPRVLRRADHDAVVRDDLRVLSRPRRQELAVAGRRGVRARARDQA
jgi:hypothetical protein